MDFLIANEPVVRLIAFAGIFAAMALLELRLPRRKQSIARARRWPGNLSIVVLNTLLVRSVFPTTAVALAALGETKG